MRPIRNNEPSIIDKKSHRLYSPTERLTATAAAIAAILGLAACSSTETDASGPASTETTTSAPASTETSTTVEEQPSESPAATVEQIVNPDISQMPIASSSEDVRDTLYPYDELAKYPDYEAFTNLDAQTKREHAAKLFVNTLHTKGDTFAQSPDFDFFENPLNASPDNTAEQIIAQWQSSIAIAGSQTVLGENEQIFSATQANEALSLAFVNVGKDVLSANLLQQYLANDSSLTTLGLYNYNFESIESSSIEQSANGQGELAYIAHIVTVDAQNRTFHLYFEYTPVSVDSTNGSGDQQTYATWSLARVEV